MIKVKKRKRIDSKISEEIQRDCEGVVNTAKMVKKVADKAVISENDILFEGELLSSGSTMLNLACSNNPFGAFLKGKYYFLVGDSTSGKTFISMTCFAEAVINENFKDYRFVYDNVEDGCLMDLERLFGDKVKENTEPPSYDDDGNPVSSYTIEDFYYNLDDCIIKAKEDKKPFIYVLDSMDSLSSVAEGEKFEQHKEAAKKNNKVAGSYGDGKAKKNSEGLRKVLKGLRDTGSILIIISQTRDNLGFGFEKKSRAGGHALKFYATTEIWTTKEGKISKIVNGVKRNVGIKVGIKLKKNRITGEDYEVSTEIYPSYGIDDIGTIIDYLVSESYFKKSKQSITADCFNFTGTKEKLIEFIEENNLYHELQKHAGTCWNAIREATKLKRKKRY